jgi:hypothetical protein
LKVVAFSVVVGVRRTFLTAMLMRIELMDPSMRTRSFSLRLMTTGVSRSSLLFLKKRIDQQQREIRKKTMTKEERKLVLLNLLDFHFGLIVTLDHSRVKVLHAHGRLERSSHGI